MKQEGERCVYVCVHCVREGLHIPVSQKRERRRRKKNDIFQESGFGSGVASVGAWAREGIMEEGLELIDSHTTHPAAWVSLYIYLLSFPAFTEKSLTTQTTFLPLSAS